EQLLSGANQSLILWARVLTFRYYLNLARVGGFHMQGISGRSHSLLLQALNNAADGSLRLALWVKINEKNAIIHFT
ncbi:hypothetical protein ACFL7E_08025, partial [Thermodesulfobacteriota bacterium]